MAVECYGCGIAWCSARKRRRLNHLAGQAGVHAAQPRIDTLSLSVVGGLGGTGDLSGRNSPRAHLSVVLGTHHEEPVHYDLQILSCYAAHLKNFTGV